VGKVVVVAVAGVGALLGGLEAALELVAQPARVRELLVAAIATEVALLACAPPTPRQLIFRGQDGREVRLGGADVERRPKGP
jgi:hypothetical protein